MNVVCTELAGRVIPQMEALKLSTTSHEQHEEAGMVWSEPELASDSEIPSARSGSHMRFLSSHTIYVMFLDVTPSFSPVFRTITFRVSKVL